MITLTRIRFPGPDDAGPEFGVLDLGEMAALLGAVDGAYVSAFKVVSPSYRRSPYDAYPRPQVRVYDGSVILDLSHDGREVAAAIGALTVALGAASAMVRREIRGWRNNRVILRRQAREEAIAEVEHRLRMDAFGQGGNIDADDSLRLLAHRASNAVAIGGPVAVSTENDAGS